MATVAITGHRPEKLGDVSWVRAELVRVLQKLQPTLLYQGMAAGADLLAAEVAIDLAIPYVATRPWAGHVPRHQDTDLYTRVLANATEIVNVDTGEEYLGPWQYHKRNEYMVDHADTVVAVWDGESKGGTAACVRYAQKRGRRIIRLDPRRQVTTLLGQPAPQADKS